MPADLSVVICSLNGSTGVDRCLRALAKQTRRSDLEIIVVDDGSTDDTSEVARAHRATLIRHITNRGAAAARNSGAKVASAPLVAFLDDDCEPEPEWAEQLLAGYEERVVAVGGPLIVSDGRGIVGGFLRRHNPLDPLELDLSKSDRLAYRFALYLRRQWASAERGQREVFSFATANMSVRLQAFFEIGGFDERFRFGSEDEDLCRRLLLRFPTECLLFMPGARVVHHFELTLRDMLRRRLAYGRGSARLYRKWPNVRPTFFPWPIAVLAGLVLALRFPLLLAVALTIPQLLYPQGIRAMIADRDVRCLLDAYMQLAQEFCHNVGFLQGMWRYRNFEAEDAVVLTREPAGASVASRCGQRSG